ncbi:MAG: hypothetical protein JXQ73_27265 [Phycisphaerae bacterium]|nr:hypothetical protein [Phycisphaerae bacterium]
MTDALAIALLNLVVGIKEGESLSQASLGNAEGVHKEDLLLERTGVGLAPFSLKEVALWVVLWSAGVVHFTRKQRRCGAAKCQEDPDPGCPTPLRTKTESGTDERADP